MKISIFKNTTAVLVAVMLSACGGGSDEANQQVTRVQARVLTYSRPAVIAVAGVFLRSGMVAETGLCANPVFNPVQSTPETAIFGCTVTAIGPQPLTIRGINGKLLYTGTLTVPTPQVEVATSAGNFTLELDPVAAPITVDNFLTYANSGYYTGTLFHRVIAGFVAQGGGYTTGLERKSTQFQPIPLESNKGLSNKRSSLAMARTSNPDSATSEFYINLVDNPNLDYRSATSPGYAVFGKVITGLDVVDRIAALRTATVGGFPNVPTPDVTIQLVLQTQ